MSPSSCPSNTDVPRAWVGLAALAAAFALASCSDDGPSGTCGPGDAPAAAFTVAIGGETVTYGGFTASINNDCTDFASGVISMTIHATQVGGTGNLTLCLPRPDLVGDAPVAWAPTRLPPDPADRLQLVDASATLAGGCTVARDQAAVAGGALTFSGYCDGGTDPAGFAITVSSTLGLRRTCPAGTESVVGTATGTVAVDFE